MLQSRQTTFYVSSKYFMKLRLLALRVICEDSHEYLMPTQGVKLKAFGSKNFRLLITALVATAPTMIQEKKNSADSHKSTSYRDIHKEKQYSVKFGQLVVFVPLVMC